MGSLPDYQARLIDKPGIPQSFWDIPPVPLEKRNYVLSLGCITLCFQGLPAFLSNKWELKTFSQKDSYDITINFFQSPISQFKHLGHTNRIYKIDWIWNHEDLFFYAFYVAGRLNLKENICNLFLAPCKPEVAKIELESALRFILPLFLFPRGIYFLHSSMVLWKGKVWVFIGPHDAGKSTLASDLKPEDAEVLGDDFNGLFFSPESPMGLVAPFRLQHRTLPIGESYPIQGFFRIYKSSQNRLESLKTGQKIAAFLASLPVLKYQSQSVEKLVNQLIKALPSIPFFALHFKKSQEVYPWLRENLSSMIR